MKSQYKNIKKISLISSIYFLSLLVFLFAFNYSSAYIIDTVIVSSSNNISKKSPSTNNILSSYFNKQKLNKKINSIINRLSISNPKMVYEINYIGEDYVNLFFALDEQNYLSYIIATNDSKEVGIEAILESNGREFFEECVKQALDNKYPKFVVDALKDSGNIAYNIKEEEIKVYFSGFAIQPNPNKTIHITIYNNKIKDILKYGNTTKTDYIDENIVLLDKNKATIALTFDDGPAKGRTEEIVQLLSDNKMSATFFMLGSRMKDNPSLVKLAFENGNEIGSHGYSHKYLTKVKQNILDYEINETKDIFRSITGSELVYLRPPYGSFNVRIRQYINSPFILWSVDPQDWDVRDTDLVSTRVLSEVKDGDIVLLHENYLTTVEALKIILPELYARGIQVVSVSDLAKLKGVSLENSLVYRSIR